jgi:hypothetical protein
MHPPGIAGFLAREVFQSLDGDKNELEIPRRFRKKGSK